MNLLILTNQESFFQTVEQLNNFKLEQEKTIQNKLCIFAVAGIMGDGASAAKVEKATSLRNLNGYVSVHDSSL